MSSESGHNFNPKLLEYYYFKVDANKNGNIDRGELK